MAFNNFPYTDMHELNLDWVLKRTKENSDSNAELQTAVADLRHDLDNLDVTEAVDAKIDAMYAAGDFEDIFDEYQKLNGDVIIVTASYGLLHPTGDPNVTIDPFTEQCKRRIEMYTTRKCYYNAIGGKGFHNDGFLQVIQNLEDVVEEPNKVGIIMVAGGGNDVSSTIGYEDIELGMMHFMTYVKSHYPNAIVRFAWLSWMRTYQSWRTFDDMNKVIRWYQQYACRYGIGYCNNSEWMFHQYHESWYLSDNYHPSTIGSYGISHGIMECILNGSCSMTEIETISRGFLTRSDTSNPIEDCAPFTVIKDNNLTTVIPGNDPATPTFKINRLGSFVPIAFGEALGLATVHSGLVYGPTDKIGNVKFNLYCILYDSEDTTGTRRTAFNGTGMIYHGFFYVTIPADSKYITGVYNKMAFFLPTITYPTKEA